MAFKASPVRFFLLDGMLTLLLSGGLRLGIRLILYEHHSEIQQLWPSYLSKPQQTPARRKNHYLSLVPVEPGKRCSGKFWTIPHLNYHVVGFLDDDRTKWGRSLHGLKVFGGVEMLPEDHQARKN